MGEDAALRLAKSDKRGLSMLDDEGAVASKPTFSRLVARLANEENIPELRGALFDSAARVVEAKDQGKHDCVLRQSLIPDNLNEVTRRRGKGASMPPRLGLGGATSINPSSEG